MCRFRLRPVLMVLAVTAFEAGAATYVVSQREASANDKGPGNAEHPWKSLTRAVMALAPGDIVLIRDGVYREHVVIKTSGTADKPICFEAAPGAANVVLTGADRIVGWKKKEEEHAVYEVAWPHLFIPWSKHMTHPDDLYHRLIGRCEQVAVDNYLLRQVSEASQLAPGTFWVDVSNQVLRAWDYANRDLNKAYVEASVRQEILRAEGAHLQVRGLRFHYAANMAQHGAVVLAGARDVLEDCVVEGMNSSGATFAAPEQVVRRCEFRDNGQIGFGANGAHGLLFTECLVENNNTKGFDRGWEAGGDKLVLSRAAVLERSRFVRNRGNGIWFDIGNEKCEVRECLIADNEDSGIFCEISYGLYAHDNVITGNGFASTAGAWGAQAGICLSSSPHCLIERNLIVANREGFDFREQTRTTPRIDNKKEQPVWNHDESIRHNVIAFNRDAQVWGWFDMKGGWHWPASSSTVHPATGSGPTQEAPAPFDVNLEKLNLRFEQNAYFANTGQGWFEWGVSWGRHKNYGSLAEFQSDLHLDSGSVVLTPEFLNIPGWDFRVGPSAVQALRQTYPTNQVPATRMGPAP